MKLFISADIEGCAGLGFTEETHKGEMSYLPFAREMTEEVLAVCKAARKAGADQIYVKDGHGDGSNLDPLAMPDYVTLIRGKSGHPYNMMFGLDSTFDGVLFVGYHAEAGNPLFSVSHTSTGSSQYIKCNGSYLSEFMLNSYTAGSMGVPVLFVSGDESICRSAAELVPGINTVVTKRGEGGATFCVPASRIYDEIKTKVKQAVGKAAAAGKPGLPETFVYEVTFKDWKKAYRMSFYPGMEQTDPFTIRMTASDWLSVVTAHSFVVY